MDSYVAGCREGSNWPGTEPRLVHLLPYAASLDITFPHDFGPDAKSNLLPLCVQFWLSRPLRRSKRQPSTSYTGPTPIDEQHGDDDAAIDDLAAGFGHLHDGQDRVQEHDQDDAPARAPLAPASAADVGAADDNGGDGRQEIGIAHALIGFGGISGEQHARKARRRA